MKERPVGAQLSFCLFLCTLQGTAGTSQDWPRPAPRCAVCWLGCYSLSLSFVVCKMGTGQPLPVNKAVRVQPQLGRPILHPP